MFKHSRIFQITMNCVMFLSLLLGSALTVTPVYAAGITVNTTADENNSGANCSLREAITAANTDTAYGGCTAGTSADVITLPPGTYTLTIAGGNEDSNATGDLDITSDLTINGAGAGSAIIQAGTIGYPNPSPNGIDRVMEILGVHSISISGITIANGNCLIPDTVCYGGGIHIQSANTVIITDSNFSGNDADQGGGIYNRGGLTIINNIFSSNKASGGPNGHGGGIVNLPPGTLDVTNSIFSGNVAAGVGGAIHLNDALTVTGSTFMGNTAVAQGGAISIYNGGTHSIANSTFSDNTAANQGGGIYNYNGTLGVTNSTFSDNGAAIGGGIYNNTAGILHLKNTLLANSASGVDCYNVSGDTIATNTNNLIEANGATGHKCGTPTVSADPNLGPLTGSPAYFPLNSSSPAINAGDDGVCAAAPMNNNSQNGVARPQDVHCDIGSFEVDPTIPVVTSIVRVNPNPTALSSVDFTVTFSEPVTDVGTADFSLTTSGVSGAAVSGVSGSGSVYTVTINTGSGNGTIRLDVLNDGSIQDLDLNSLSAGFTTGESYTVDKTVTLIFNSLGVNDGWILESSETSSKGGTMNSAATTFLLGDDLADRQYRAILHFDTSSLPDTAVITSATLKIRKQGATVGTNPFTILGNLQVGTRKPAFGTTALALKDFKSAAGINNVSTFGVTPLVNWYSAVLNSAGNSYINRAGTTQFRLYFTTDDNNDNGNDFMKFFSGNAAAANRPQLVIEYYVQ